MGQKTGNIRIFVLSFFILAFWIVVVYKLYHLQIEDNLNFQALANNEQQFNSSVSTTRGIISSSDGVELAINVPSYTVNLYLPNLKDENAFEQTILPILHITTDAYSHMKSPGVNQFILAKGIAPDTKSVIESKMVSANEGSLSFTLQESRYYPNNSLLSQVLGYVDITSGKGLYGLEGYFDGDLTGVNGSILGNQDQYGNPILNGNFSVIPPTLGEDITTTINANLQSIVEEKLKESVDNEQADLGAVIVMDAKTGAIVAMAGYPTFDPNSYYNGYVLDCATAILKDTPSCKDATVQQSSDLVAASLDNPAISFVYEPGSVMKAITVSAALQEGGVTPSDIFNDQTGYFAVDGAKIYNFNKKPDGQMNMGQVLKLSSNVGASMIAQKIGSSLLYKYYQKFGIGQLTNITLQGEQTDLLPKESSWKDIDTATASFGQFVSATPLQVVSIYQAIANGGVRMQPYIVQSVTKNGQRISTKPQSLGSVISSKTASELTQMLVYATTGEPAYGLRFMKQYMPIIAGKTGTAQVPNIGGTGYINGQINTTYVAYAPAADPRFVMLTMLKNPRNAQYAADSAVPLWASIAPDLFLYYKIAPE